MGLKGVHHFSFTVTDLDRTVAFYGDLLGFRLIGRKDRSADDLGGALRGPAADDRSQSGRILIADMELGGTRLEFIQYLEPSSAARPYPGDPCVAGSAHIALECEDIDSEYARLTAAGVRFHGPVRTVRDPSRPVWRWGYFRDPDGICLELVESVEETVSESPA